MDCDRRALLSALLAAMWVPGCARGAIPAGGWEAFAANFLQPDGRIVDTGNGQVSHSEGQGYGLILAEAAGDRSAFERIWRWTDEVLSRRDVRLFSWRYDPTAAQPVGDPNNAADGDLLIAWGLLRAARRWGNAGYAEQSAAIRAAVLSRLVGRVGPRLVLLPGLEGFVQPGHVTLNPAIYVWPALHAFAAAEGGQAWLPMIRDGEKLIADARFGPASLPTDWVDVLTDGTVRPAVGKPAYFGFDAIRVPLYLAWAGRRAALQPFSAFWSSYVSRGRPIPAWVDVTDGAVAPYALSDGGMAVVDVTLGHHPRIASGDYYSTALGALARLA